jgi:hypothetical protein
MKASEETRRQKADEHYGDIGRSLAALVVEGGKTPYQAWGLLRGLGLFPRWMLDHWITRYREEAPERPRGRHRAVRGRRRTPSATKSSNDA